MDPVIMEQPPRLDPRLDRSRQNKMVVQPQPEALRTLQPTTTHDPSHICDKLYRKGLMKNEERERFRDLMRQKNEQLEM